MTEKTTGIGRERPRCIAVLICNEVIEDVRTRSKTLVGLFDTIHAHSLPAVHPRMFIMAQFTDGVGEWPVSFRISGPENDEIALLDGTAKITDPLSVLDIVFDLHGLPLRTEGVHFVDVHIAGEHAAGRRFNVTTGGAAS